MRITRIGSLGGIIVGGSLGEDESVSITWDTSGGHLGRIGEGSARLGVPRGSQGDLGGIWEPTAFIYLCFISKSGATERLA